MLRVDVVVVVVVVDRRTKEVIDEIVYCVSFSQAR
jgi:hypothetical protein